MHSRLMSLFLFSALLLISSSTLWAQQKSFSTAELAADALYDAIARKNEAQAKELMGQDYIKLLPIKYIQNKNQELFVSAWAKSHKLINKGSAKKIIEIGLMGWTFPIPLRKNDSGWFFDTAEGLQVIRIRRIGRNELSSIQAMLAYYDAQKEYAEQDRNANGLLEYAQKFVSTVGKKDGLYWPVADDEKTSPLGVLFSQKEHSRGYHGYYFKILKSQGKHAYGGAYQYLIGSSMRSGFALLAWPVEYGETGVMSFIINHDGQIFEQNLGKDTMLKAEKITQFDPDYNWLKVENVSE